MKFTTLGKKLIAFIALIGACFAITGCLEEKSPTLEQAQTNVNNVLDKMIFDVTALEKVTSDLDLVERHAAYKDVKIEWTSSEPDIVEIVKDGDSLKAAVTRPQTDDPRIAEGTDYVKVTLTVTAQQQSGLDIVKKSKSFSLNVISTNIQLAGTVKEIKARIVADMVANKVKINTNDSKHALFCLTYGRVIAQTSKSTVVSDGTDSIIVYGDYTKECKTGDLVEVQGKVYSYYGQIEFGSEQKVKKLKETDSHASIKACEIVETTIEDYTAALSAAVDSQRYITNQEDILAFSGAYYRIVAKVCKGSVVSGDNYYLEDGITGTQVSIYHYASDDAAIGAKLDALNGKYAVIEVVTIDRYSTNDIYRVIFASDKFQETAAPVITDEQKVAKAVKAIEATKHADTYFDGDDFVLPTYEGVSIKWEMNPTDVLVNGKIVAKAKGTLTLTATVKSGAAVGTATLTLKVDKKEVFITVSEFKALPIGENASIKGLVAGVYNRGFVLYDQTGYILVYTNKEVNVAAGDYVKVNGKFDAYPAGSTAYQVGDPTYEKLTETTTLTLPSAVEWTATEVDAAWTQVCSETGYNFAGPIVNMEVKITSVGKYNNGEIAGSTAKLSFSYPTDSAAALLVKDQTVRLCLIPISYSLSKGVPTYFNFIVVGEAQEVGGGEEGGEQTTAGNLVIENSKIAQLTEGVTGYKAYKGEQTIDGYKVTINDVMPNKYADTDVVQMKKQTGEIKFEGTFKKMKIVIATTYEFEASSTVLVTIGSEKITIDQATVQATKTATGKKNGNYDLYLYTIEVDFGAEKTGVVTLSAANAKGAIYLTSIEFTK